MPRADPPRWLPDATAEWVSDNEPTLAAVFEAFDATGRWPDPDELQRSLWGEGRELRLVSATAGMPRELGAVEYAPRRVVLNLFGLGCVPQARSLLGHYVDAMRLAFERYRNPAAEAQLRRADLEDGLGLTSRDAERLAVVLMRDAPFLGSGTSEPGTFAREIDPRVVDLADVRDADALLERLASHRLRPPPVFAAPSAAVLPGEPEAIKNAPAAEARGGGWLSKRASDHTSGDQVRLQLIAAVLALVVMVAGAVVLAALALGGDEDGSSSTVTVDQPPVLGISVADAFRGGAAKRYAAAVRALDPELQLSFRRGSGAEPPTLRRAATATGLFGGADRALRTGDGTLALPPQAALSGDTDRTVVFFVRTEVRGRQTLVDAGEPSTGQRFLVAATDPASVPGSPDQRSGVILVCWDADVFLPGLDLSDGRWHQLAVIVRDGRFVEMLVDGEAPLAFVNEATGRYRGPVTQPVELPTKLETAAGPLTLGGPGPKPGSWRGPLAGWLDEVTLLDRALSRDDIKRLWNTAAGR